MAIELRQSLKLSQQLVITPQLQQAIKLLQLSRVELVDMVQNELLENPVLEEAPQLEDEEVPAEMSKAVEETPELSDKPGETHHEVEVKDGDFKDSKEFEWENYMETYTDSGESPRNFSATDELPSYENIVAKTTSLQDHLEWQLHMTPMTDQEEEIGVGIIGALDDNGYLTLPLEEFCEKNGFPLEDAEEILKVIQEFDPIGVGARNLQECLLLQARQFVQERPLLEAMITQHLPLLEKRDYPTIARKLKVPLQKIIKAARIITDMEPKPGRPYAKNDTQYITPDVYVYKMGNDFTVVLNEEGLPRLRVSPYYRGMVTKNGNNGNGEAPAQNGQAKNDQAKDYVQDKLKGALWLIKSIHQRQRTLYRVSKCIVKFQRAFLEKGIDHLRPMVLRDVAEEIGMHESTVSRATSNKYMHTPQGIFELKFFFNSGVSATTGSDIASETVKEKIRTIIAAENETRPFSDQEIVEHLKKLNIEIARRTVAKYREMLGILPSSKRRHLY